MKSLRATRPLRKQSVHCGSRDKGRGWWWCLGADRGIRRQLYRQKGSAGEE